MKRTFSIVLTVLLIATTAMLLVACGSGGIESQEDWDNAMQAFLTADAVTLKINDNRWTYKAGLIFESHVKYDITIAFDAEMGVVAITRIATDYNIVGVPSKGGTHEMYYVLDGTNVIFYRKYVSEYSNDWKHRAALEFDTADEAAAYLRELYTNPTLHTSPYSTDAEFPTFAELQYSNFTADFWGKFEYETTIERRVHTYELNFANGKPSKFGYDTKIPGDIADTDTYSVSISYSAKITLPSDLPTEDLVD